MRLKVNQLLQTEKKKHCIQRKGKGKLHVLGFIKKIVLYSNCDVSICSHYFGTK